MFVQYRHTNHDIIKIYLPLEKIESTLHKTNLAFILLVCFLLSCRNEDNQAPVVDALEATTEETSNPFDSLGIDFITGNFNPASDSSFVLIDISHADREGMYMKTEAYSAFKQMWEAAKADGVDLVIRSATRNFDYQKSIWEKKWTGKTLLSDGTNALKDLKTSEERAIKILEYSSMPGTSRHHWGTDIDLNSFNNEWFETGQGLEVFEWLSKNAADYGFCRPYTEKGEDRPEGYNEEKWHWSYVPLSEGYTQFAKEHLKNENIQGFLGSSVSNEINVVENYVLGINHECK